MLRQAACKLTESSTIRIANVGSFLYAPAVLSVLHESLRLLFQNRPELAPELLHEALGLELPKYSSVRVESADLTQIVTAEYRADLVVLLVDGKPVLAIVVEVQLAIAERKRFTWPAYGACLRSRFECPALVLVVTVDEVVARWASRAIAIGPSSTFTPWVVGPEAVPVITDPNRAEADPELGVLSAMAHGRGDVDTAVKIGLAARAGLVRVTDRDYFVLYSDLIFDAMSEAARKALEMLPQGYQFKDPLIRESIEKGRVEAQISSIFDVLEARGIEVSADCRGKIVACRDAQLLTLWHKRSVTVAAVEELFTH